MKLSILICTIVGREKSLTCLLDALKKQTNKQVEVLFESDNKKITTGAKRNILLKKAQGDYICFVDDDDMISEDYVSKILKALETNPDCCSLQGRLIRGKATNLFIHSLQYDSWFEKNSIYYRYPNHLNTVKRELALQVMFPDKTHGEDKHYSDNLFLLLKTEVKIEGIIYFYLAG